MILIDNQTDLSYEEIGNILDRHLKNLYKETIYYGKEEFFGIILHHKNYKISVQYGKNRTKYIIKEVKS